VVGVLVASHGNLAGALLRTAESIAAMALEDLAGSSRAWRTREELVARLALSLREC